MFARHDRIVGFVYLLADALLILGSFWVAHVLRSRLDIPRPLMPLSQYWWIVLLAAAIWLGVGLATGIYGEIREEDLRRVFVGPVKVGSLSVTLLFALIFALKIRYISRLLLSFFAVADLVAMIVFRLLARRWSDPLRRTLAGLRHLLLVGETPDVLEVARTIEANEPRGMRLSGFVALGSGVGARTAVASPALRCEYPVYSLSELPELLRRHVIDELIFAVTKDDLDKLEETFLICEQEGVKTRVLLSFFPQSLSKVYLERLGDRPLLTFSTTPENEYLLFLKRALDFLMALGFLLILSPVFLTLALLVKLTSQGSVFYRQTRCGLGGRRFTLYKFRSMYRGADSRQEELQARNEMDGPVFKIRDDPRRTLLGRLMRKFSLDELPQLINILRGDMSFVGPRPPLPEEVEKYERWQRRRLRMQPGLTCLWALEGRNKLNFQRWMELDLAYIDNWSPALDWKILFKTIPVVLLGRGAS